jgi:hypothetical protein
MRSSVSHDAKNLLHNVQDRLVELQVAYGVEHQPRSGNQREDRDKIHWDASAVPLVSAKRTVEVPGRHVGRCLLRFSAPRLPRISRLNRMISRFKLRSAARLPLRDANQ